MARKIGFTDKQIEEMIRMYNDEKLSYAKIAEKFDCHTTAIAQRLKGKVQPRTTKETARKYTADFDYFEVIDTEEKAYWLGFFFADGYQSKLPSRLLGIGLSKKDEPHLEKFKNAIKATHPILTYEGSNYGEGTQYARLHIISDKLVEDVERHGLLELKTDNLKPPTTIPDELIRHFIRGYFDGDGCWSWHSAGAPGRLRTRYKATMLGTKEMLDWIAEQMMGKRKALYPTRAGGKNNYSLEYHGKADINHIFDYLYKDATVYLERKYATAVEIRPLVE